MRFIKWWLTAFFVILPCLCFSDDIQPMWFSFMRGDVQVYAPDTGQDWTSASVNFPLTEGDRLWVPQGGRLETRIAGGVAVRADQGTAVDILRLDADSVQIYVDNGGHVYINDQRGGIRTVQVDVPDVSLRSYDNTI
ncbi:MAG: hypothetical protein PHY31_07330, partial [Smithellaceae bacterium]|nr:hypothetical protein [Smithellaceae bacterium]